MINSDKTVKSVPPQTRENEKKRKKKREKRLLNPNARYVRPVPPSAALTQSTIVALFSFFCQDHVENWD